MKSTSPMQAALDNLLPNQRVKSGRLIKTDVKPLAPLNRADRATVRRAPKITDPEMERILNRLDHVRVNKPTTAGRRGNKPAHHVARYTYELRDSLKSR